MGPFEPLEEQQNKNAKGFPSWKDRLESHQGDNDQQNCPDHSKPKRRWNRSGIGILLVVLASFTVFAIWVHLSRQSVQESQQPVANQRNVGGTAKSRSAPDEQHKGLVFILCMIGGAGFASLVFYA